MEVTKLDVNEAVNRVASGAHEAVDKAAGVAAQVAEKASDVAAQVADKVTEKKKELKDVQEDLTETVRLYVHQNPVKALAIAAIGGFVLSRLLRSR